MKANNYINCVASLCKEAKQRVFVLGNSSVDMDSVVTALTLGYALETTKTDEKTYLPLINCPKAELDYRFDIVHLFNKYGVEKENLLYLDMFEQIKEDDEIILVDHNEIDDKRFEANVVGVVDHHKWFNSNRPNLKWVALKTPLASALTIAINQYLVPHGLLDHFEPGFLLPTLLSDSHFFKEQLRNFKWAKEDWDLAEKLCELGGLDKKTVHSEYKKEKKNVEKNYEIGVEGMVKKDRKYYNYNGSKLTYSTIPISYKKYTNKFAPEELTKVLDDYDYYAFQFTKKKGANKLIVFYAPEKSLEPIYAAFKEGFGEVAFEKISDKMGYIVIDGTYGRKTIEPRLRVTIKDL